MRRVRAIEIFAPIQTAAHDILCLKNPRLALGNPQNLKTFSTGPDLYLRTAAQMGGHEGGTPVTSQMPDEGTGGILLLARGSSSVSNHWNKLFWAVMAEPRIASGRFNKLSSPPWTEGRFSRSESR